MTEFDTLRLELGRRRLAETTQGPTGPEADEYVTLDTLDAFRATLQWLPPLTGEEAARAEREAFLEAQEAHVQPTPPLKRGPAYWADGDEQADED